VLELVGTIGRQLGRETVEPLVLDAAVGEIHDQVLSAAKARAVLEWQPAYDLQQGLDETIGWYRAYLAPNEVGT